jgi:hypothetical protein
MNGHQTVSASLVTALIVFFSPVIAAAPFQNGSFESPDLLPDGSVQVLQTGDTRISGWVVGGTNQSLTWIKNADAWTAHDGNYLIGFERDSPPGGWIEQTFDTVPGKSYRVSIAVWAVLSRMDGVSWLRAEIFSGSGGLISSTEIPRSSFLGVEWNVARFSFTGVSVASTLRLTEISQRLASYRIDRVSIEMEDPTVEITLYPGIKVSGIVGSTYALQYQNTLDTNIWITLQTFTLNQSPTLLFDTNGLQSPRRIYRAVKQP